MLTQAASCFSTSRSASRSAAARSGRLVNTKSVLMPQSFIDGRVAQAHAEHLLQRVSPFERQALGPVEVGSIAAGDAQHLETVLEPRQGAARDRAEGRDHQGIHWVY